MLNNLLLTTKNVLPEGTKTFQVISVKNQYVYDEKRQRTDEIAKVIFECVARRGDSIKIKLPADISNDLSKVANLIKKNSTVYVKFKDLTLRPFAMLASDNTGTVFSGVCGSAENFTIVETVPAPSFDDDDEDDDTDDDPIVIN